MPGALVEVGAVLPVRIEMPTDLRQLRTSQKRPIPEPVSGLALIDTGATKSAADMQVMTRLQVNQMGTVELGTAAGRRPAPLYPARFIVAPGTPGQIEIDFGSVAGIDLAGLTVGGQGIIALIGRDVLASCIFVYNGPAGTFSVAL